jgi:CHAT domain-containing protein
VAIHRGHYPHGSLLGALDGPDSRPASPENVLRLLPRPGSAGASLLHLGCHAQAAPRPADGRLILQGGEPLSMQDILAQAQTRPPGEPGGLVILAACGSDLTDVNHDEALTLATSFMAAGAVGTLGTRWPVEDLTTMAFMIMFHHYLTSGYDSPATALRATQAWMLDPRRAFPAEFPLDMARRLRASDLSRVTRWAAFTYQGQ